MSQFWLMEIKHILSFSFSFWSFLTSSSFSHSFTSSSTIIIIVIIVVTITAAAGAAAAVTAFICYICPWMKRLHHFHLIEVCCFQLFWQLLTAFSLFMTSSCIWLNCLADLILIQFTWSITYLHTYITYIHTYIHAYTCTYVHFMDPLICHKE